MAGCVHDLEAAEDRQHLAVRDVGGDPRRGRHRREDTATAGVGEGVANARREARSVGRVDEDLGAAGGELGRAARVIRVAVGADHSLDIVEGASVGSERALDEARGSAEAGVDQGHAAAIRLQDRDDVDAPNTERTDAWDDLLVPHRSVLSLGALSEIFSCLSIPPTTPDRATSRQPRTSDGARRDGGDDQGMRLNQSAASPAPPSTRIRAPAANHWVTSCSSCVKPTLEPRLS